MTEMPQLATAERNVAEYSVSEISQAVKRTLEGNFEHVRVRGEVGRPNYHGSGHLYFTLKDDSASLDSVCWRGTVGRLGLQLEEGMEVVCTGRISSYPRSSRYQIVVESVELAGEGALLKLLEDRRKRLAAEGLFEEERKKDIPFLPEIIGVVTSPTGAVIRDILHRLADRFPRRVILWPVPVQGEGADARVAAAIEGFNALAAGGVVPRPDVLIVARGGGSLEDLWTFNEEPVVRAAAASEIPLISAIGHETDTTLIDFAADRRAPTPTAAAEMAVPVRADLRTQILDIERRTGAAIDRVLRDGVRAVEGFARGLPRPERLLEQANQAVDDQSDRLRNGLANLLAARGAGVERAAAGIRSPAEQVARAGERVGGFGERLSSAVEARMENARSRYAATDAARRMTGSVRRREGALAERVASLAALLDSLSYERVLERGFAVVRDESGLPVARASDAAPGSAIEIQFADARLGARLDGTADAPPPAHAPAKKRRPRRRAGERSCRGLSLARPFIGPRLRAVPGPRSPPRGLPRRPRHPIRAQRGAPAPRP